MNSQFQSTQHHPFKDLQNNTIGYCTDVEGNYEYWKRYLRLSKVLERTETGGVRLKSDCHFVYGGDVCDRGYGDLRILKDLVELKSENPDRVHLILGNRDINKLRLLTELQPESYSQPGETYWTGPLKQTDDFTMANRLKAVSSLDRSLEPSLTRLQQILNQTMGAPAAFEYRRRELLDIASAAASPQDQKTDVTDEEVVQSFMGEELSTPTRPHVDRLHRSRRIADKISLWRNSRRASRSVLLVSSVSLARRRLSLLPRRPTRQHHRVSPPSPLSSPAHQSPSQICPSPSRGDPIELRVQVPASDASTPSAQMDRGVGEI
jgi:hypothetical protein